MEKESKGHIDSWQVYHTSADKEGEPFWGIYGVLNKDTELEKRIVTPKVVSITGNEVETIGGSYTLGWPRLSSANIFEESYQVARIRRLQMELAEKKLHG